MRGLSPTLQHLVASGRLEGRPTLADRERVLAGLQKRLALREGPAIGRTAATQLPRGTGGTALRATVLMSAGSALIAGGVALLQGLTVPPPSVSEALLAIPASGAPVFQAGSSVSFPKQPDDRTRKPVTGPTSQSSPTASLALVVPRGMVRVRDTLAEEVYILSRAEREFYAGRPEGSLVLLGEHERRFSSGVLAEERIAAKILALCALGRETEARSLLGQLSPQSVHGSARAQVCAAQAHSAKVK